MNFSEYCKYDALGLGELVRKGEVTAKELAETALAGIEKVNPELNAVIEVYRDRIDELDEADIADGPFKGVPFLIKDIAAMQKGRKCEQGSRLFKGFVADHDSEFVRRFKDAGLNSIGRTSCPEMGSTICTETALYGITRNPWNPGRTPGGSSGGSGAIVAAGAVPMAHANDGGGSTRIPASMNGLVGLKCSRGRMSYAPDGNDHLFPLYSDLVVSHSVRDTAAALDAIAGPAPGEAALYLPPQRPFLQVMGRPTGKLRTALAANNWGTYQQAPDVAAEMKRIGALLETMGHEVVDDAPPIDFEQLFEVFLNMWIVLIAMDIDATAKALDRPISDETLEPGTLKLYEYGMANASLAEYLAGIAHSNTVSRQLGQFFTTCDLILTPTISQPVPEVGSYSMDFTDAKAFLENVLRVIPYTPLNNFTGTPAISVPLCRTDDDMPLGAHFMAPMGGEATLIRLAAALEEAAPWDGAIPKIHVSR